MNILDSKADESDELENIIRPIDESIILNLSKLHLNARKVLKRLM